MPLPSHPRASWPCRREPLPATARESFDRGLAELPRARPASRAAPQRRESHEPSEPHERRRPGRNLLQVALQVRTQSLALAAPFSARAATRTHVRRRDPSAGRHTVRTHVPPRPQITVRTARARRAPAHPLVPAARGRLPRRLGGRPGRARPAGASPSSAAARAGGGAPPPRSPGAGGAGVSVTRRRASSRGAASRRAQRALGATSASRRAGYCSHVVRDGVACRASRTAPKR